MANIYVRSTDGSDADNGSTWALAKATLAGASAIDAAGDTIYLSQVHAETSATAQTIALAGTATSPVRVLCGNDAAEPPTALATTATVSTTGNNSITFTGAGYFYGVGVVSGDSANGTSISLTATSTTPQYYDSCTFTLRGTGVGGRLVVGSGANGNSSLMQWVNCSVKFANTAQTMPLQGVNWVWRGGSLLSGGTTPTSLFSASTSQLGRASKATIEGVDFSNAASTVNLVGTADVGSRFIFRNCKLPASWSGALLLTPAAGNRVELYNCDTTDTNYRLWIEDYAGSIKSETTIVRSGGASDGVTPLSWKMASSANAGYPVVPLKSGEIAKYNSTVGSSLTATIEVVTDGVTLKDDECWIDVQYLGTSGFPLSLFVNDCKVDVLATAANQTSSSVTWTTTGLSSPVKQKLSVTFTPQEVGFIYATVYLCKASTTVYVDPVLTVV